MFLLFFRALLGIGMGAEWPAGARSGDGKLAVALARIHERHPARLVGHRLPAVERGLWSVLQYIGWRGMLWIGILPALAVVYVRKYVKEPAVWLENRRKQRAGDAKCVRRCSSSSSPALLGNTLTACWWMASGFVTYYSIWALFATHLQKDLGLGPATGRRHRWRSPTSIGFLAMGFWGWVGDDSAAAGR